MTDSVLYEQLNRFSTDLPTLQGSDFERFTSLAQSLIDTATDTQTLQEVRVNLTGKKAI